MRFPSLLALLVLALGCVRLPMARAAAPHPAPPVSLAPVRVTSDLWESPLDRIPASVSVYDQGWLQEAAVRHFGDLVDGIPNLTWSGGTSRPRYFQIRGVGENSQYEGETPDSAVRFLVDDFDFTGLGTLAGSFDVQQVEVLRGPQAGAFGANAAGGLVRLVTAAPTPFWTGQVEASAGGDALRSGGFAVGGPLSTGANPESLMMRLAVHQHRSDGFRRNLTWQRDTNARDERMARLRVTANPGGAWRWEGALLHSRVANGYDEFALDNNGRNTFSNRPGRDEQRSAAASLRGTYRGGAATRFTTVSQASRVDSVYSYDDDWTAASYDGFSDLRRRREVFSEELRLDSAVARGALPGLDRWTLGAHLARTTEASAYTNEDPGNLRGLTTSYESTQGALYGQGGRDLTPHTRLIVGLRAEWVDLAGEGVRTRYRKARGTHDPVVRFRPGFSGALPGGKLSLEHDLSPQHLAFLSVTRGYKAGGINVDARINPPADPLTYATETLWNFEAGLRGSWADRRLVGECTAFRLERRDPQVRDSAGFGGNYRFFTANGRKASVSGAEASGTWTFNRAWSAQASAAWMESELQPFVLPNGHAGGGRALANTPRHGHTLALRYRGDTGLFGRIEQVGRARQYDSNNQNEARRAFRVLNATLGWSWGRAWTVAVWGRNLLDVRYEKRVFFFGNEDPDYPERRYEDRADPRQVGATVTFRF